MRVLIAGLAAVLPLAAAAQEPIPDTALQQVYERCLPACQQGHSYAFCADVCGCAANELSRNWTMDEFRRQSATLSDGDGTAVRGQMSRLAAFCAKKMQQP